MEVSSGSDGIHLPGNAALFAGSSVLVKNSLLDGLVDGLDGGLVSAVGLGGVTGGDSSLELLQSGLQNGLGRLVALVRSAGEQDSLLGGFNVGHDYTSSNSVSFSMSKNGLMQKHIIAAEAQEINSFFEIF